VVDVGDGTVSNSSRECTIKVRQAVNICAYGGQDVIRDVVYGDFVTFEITTIFKINAVHELLPKSL
jgi:hypothetical protein